MKGLNRRRGICGPFWAAIYHGTKGLQERYDERKAQKVRKLQNLMLMMKLKKIAIKITGKAFKYIDDLVGVTLFTKNSYRSADEAKMTARRIKDIALAWISQKLIPGQLVRPLMLN